MGCGASQPALGGRHKTLKQKEMQQNIARKESVTTTIEKRALDREGLLKTIFESMDRDKNGFVDLCAPSAFSAPWTAPLSLP